MTDHIVGTVDKKVILYQHYKRDFATTIKNDAGWMRPYAVDLFNKHIRSHSKEVILDLGCRTGYYLPVLGPQAVGIEGVAQYVELAKSVGRNVVHGDAQYCHEYFPPDSFDAVFSHNTLEHLDHPKLAMENMRKVIKTGGLALHIFPKEGKGARLNLAGKSVSKHRCSFPSENAVKEIITDGWKLKVLERSVVAHDWVLVLEAV